VIDGFRGRDANGSLWQTVLIRLLSGILVVWASVSLLFVVFHILPGSSADAMLSGDRVVSDAERQRIEHDLGLDQSLVVQYGDYWNNILHGDLGSSFSTGRPVGDMLRSAAPASLRLAFWALLLEIGIGIGVAVLVHRRRHLRNIASGVSVFAIAVPIFVFGYILQLALGVYPTQHDWPQWTRFPVQGIGDDHWWFVIPLGSQWRYLAMPVVCLTLVSSAILLRLTFASLRTAARAPHVDGARARGISERAVFRRHVLRNATLPLITFLAADLVALFGSAVLTETVFNWPGVGSVVARGIERRDIPVVLGASIVLAIAYVLVNTVIDVVYRFVDPRLRDQR
jgi:ABC-type dipeptide/oligopeptide/nickel transport system permease component